MSSLITLFLFLIAGNLISVKQPGLTFININSINFSRASGDKPEIKNNSPVKQPINSKKRRVKIILILVTHLQNHSFRILL